MSQLVFNSFPRSANVYLGHTAPSVINSMCSTVHMPEIFMVQELPMVTVFRKPEDAIASVINKQLERSGPDPIVSIDSVFQAATHEVALYKKYMIRATENQKHLYIAKFDDITKDTLNHLVRISEKFNLPTTDNYEQRFASIRLEGSVWSDQMDGHLPREKNDIRLKIEDIVSGLDFVKELNEEYYKFIQTHVS
jgi:hypothetical protein